MANEAHDNDIDDKEAQKARTDANNAKAVKAAANVAANSGNPYAAAVGKGIQAVDKVTGGKGSQIVGKGLTKANQIAPGGRTAQNALNAAGDSGATDMANDALAAKNGEKENNNEKGGPQSSPSSDNKKNENGSSRSDRFKNARDKVKDFLSEKDEEESGEEEEKDTLHEVAAKGFKAIAAAAMPMIISAAPIILVIMIVLLIVGGAISAYEDGVGTSSTTGGNTGGVEYSTNDLERQEFYNRVAQVQAKYQENGKYIEPLYITAVFTSLKSIGAVTNYDDMTTSKMEQVADYMFNEGIYDEDYFKSNLANKLFPSYKSGLSSEAYLSLADEVFKYVEDYKSLVGEEKNTCVAGDSCTYDIKGFQLNQSKSSSQNIKASDIYVRLMQCGGTWGGTAGQPLEGEDLVPFEKYVLGAAYAEMGDISMTKNFENKIKTQFVVARSFTLARHADVGGWRSLKQENGKWILQIGNCTRDQLYCDPDRGCSKSKSSNFHLYSGTGKMAGTYKGALKENHPYRKLAQEAQGETLVNNKGYIIQAGFKMAENRKYTSLANSGYDYKQILLSVYNSGNKSFGAASIYKADCGGTGSSCSTYNSESAAWKQKDPKWSNIRMGTSNKTIGQIGCLATSIAIQISRSGVKTNVTGEFNPGTFVEYINKINGFDGGDFIWSSATKVAPKFIYQNNVSLKGMDKSQKYDTIKSIITQPDVYAVCEVYGDRGQHWVALEGVEGGNFKIMDPGSNTTVLWGKDYFWNDTSRIVYYKVVR